MKKLNFIYIFILQITIFGYSNCQGLVNLGEILHIENGASLFVDGDIQNNSSADFVNNGTVIITGNIKNNQNMPIPSLGTWQFSGSTSQRFTGGVPLLVKDIIFNNPAGFTIGVPTTLKINGIATFNQGIFGPVNTSYPLSFADGSSINTNPAPSNASFVNGTVLKEGIGGFIFPIGNSLIYQPIEVNLATNTAGLLAKYSATNIGTGNFVSTGTDPTPLIGYNSGEYWDIGPISGGTATGTVKLYWDSQNETLAGGYTTRKVAHKVGANWLNEGTNGTGSDASGSVSSNTISTWSPFTVGYIQATALPITLINFTGKKVKEINVLNWQTSSEINASHFDIERSIDGLKFEKIGKVFSNFVSKENLKYEFIDYQTGSPIGSVGGFYRLKLVDLDGKYNYSKIIYIINDADNQIVGQFYPNPALDNFSDIDIVSEEKSEWQFSTIDVNGKLIKSEKIFLEKGANKIQISGLRNGINLVRFENNKLIETRKVIKIISGN